MIEISQQKPAIPTRKKQELRYTAFIDILGFQNAVLEMENEPEKYEKIALALTNISTMNILRLNLLLSNSDANAVNTFERYQDLRVQVFSDCILISAKDNDMGLVAVTAMSALAYWMLFSHGFYARGGITKDFLTHNEDILFGRALVRSYSLENKVAIFPRIILSQEIHDDLAKKKPKIPTKTDFDGQPFLDVFDSTAKKIIDHWNKTQSDSQRHIDLESGRQALLRNISRMNNPSINQKLTWLKNYFNQNALNIGLSKI